MPNKQDGISSELVAELIIEKQAERIKELETQFKQTHEWLCDRNQQIAKQSAALKLAREAMEDCGRIYCTLIGNALMHEPSMFERSVVCKFVRGWFRNHKPVLAVKALAAIDSLQKGE